MSKSNGRTTRELSSLPGEGARRSLGSRRVGVGVPASYRRKDIVSTDRAKELHGESRRPAPPLGPRRGRGGGGRTPSLLESERLSATDISALASMKNVAKCDTWCELQNPANHQLFERKLRPKPFGRGHACLGVVNPPAPGHPCSCKRTGGETLGRRTWPPVGAARAARRGAVGRKSSMEVSGTTASGGSDWFGCVVVSSPLSLRARTIPSAIPGQAGLPAEFKHINKRRRRN